jgi:hypothetical protein
MTSSITAQSHKSPETLEHEIDQQRASISSLVDALESKLTPGQLFDQALAYTKGNGGEFFQNLGTTVKNNPIPTVLASLSLAWLAMNQNRPIAPPRVHEGPSLMDRASAAASKVGEVVGSAKEQLRGAADSVTARTAAVKDSVTSRASAVKESATTWRDGASDRLSDSSDRLNRSTHDLTHQAKQTGAQMKGQFEYLLQEQPLVLAAVGLALGAAFGAALPVTRHEHRLLGKTSDSLTQQVKAKAQEVKQAVTTEARSVVEEVKNQAGGEGSGGGAGTAQYKADDVNGQPKDGGTDLSRGLGTH